MLAAGIASTRLSSALERIVDEIKQMIRNRSSPLLTGGPAIR